MCLCTRTGVLRRQCERRGGCSLTWHALESCGLLWVVQVVSRRRKRTRSTSEKANAFDVLKANAFEFESHNFRLKMVYQDELGT